MTVKRRTIEKIMFIINGKISLTPKTKNPQDINKVHRGEEDEEEKEVLSTPQMPYLEKFFAIAM
ncbi:hypothetical protein JW890_04525 [candidate division WOR-3 bacterium]|nr:hypothetical protein [candidate division WOR-3 bacterium]